MIHVVFLLRRKLCYRADCWMPSWQRVNHHEKLPRCYLIGRSSMRLSWEALQRKLAGFLVKQGSAAVRMMSSGAV